MALFDLTPGHRRQLFINNSLFTALDHQTLKTFLPKISVLYQSVWNLLEDRETVKDFLTSQPMLVLPVWRRKSMKPERSGRQLVPHHSPPVYVTSRPRIRAIENQRKGRLVTWNTIFKAGLWDLYVWWSNWHWTKEILMTLLLMSCSQSNAHFRRLVYTVYWGIWPSILKYKLSGNLVHHDNWSYLWTIGEKANFENISKYVLSDLSGVYVPASSQGWVGAAIIEAIAECSSLFALITPWQLDHKSRRSLRWPVYECTVLGKLGQMCICDTQRSSTPEFARPPANTSRGQSPAAQTFSQSLRIKAHLHRIWMSWC